MEPGHESTNSSTQHTFESNPTVLDGDRVVEKLATGTARTALRREASVLTQLDLRFAVRFLELREYDERTVMVTQDAGARTLATVSKLTDSELVRALGDCVLAVLQLRAAGWVHGALKPEHVIVGARGRTRICSFRNARHSSSVDPAETEQLLRTDALALLDLIDAVVGQDPAGHSWLARRRRARLQQRIAATASVARTALELGGNVERVLRTLRSSLSSAQTTGTSELHRRRTAKRSVPTSTRQPTSTRSAPARSAPTRTLQTGPQRGQPVALRTLQRFGHGLAPGNRSTRRVAQVTAVSITLFGLAAAVPALAARGPEALGGHRSDTSGTAGGSLLPTIPATTESSPPSTTAAARDQAGSPTTAAPVVSHDGMLYTIGQPGDLTLVDDWGCSGSERLLLLRPSSGDVYVFDDWATVGVPSQGRLVASVPGASALESSAGADACPVPVARTGDGALTELDLRAPGGIRP